MKSFIIAACIVACAWAATPNEETAQVLRSTFDQDPQGNFEYGYDTENGISGQAQGKVKNLGPEQVALEVNGESSYTAPNGEVIRTVYRADENGYQPQGAHLPVAPEPEPIPEYIQRALIYIKEHPYVEKKN